MIYANCFGGPRDDVLVTAEPAVAAAAPDGTTVVMADRGVDPDHAEALNCAIPPLAVGWAELLGEDPTVVEGVSAADLAGGQVSIHVLVPAVRGVLEAGVALQDGAPESVTVVVPESDSPHFTRYERLQAVAFAATVEQRTNGATTVRSVRARDPRDALLVAKYARTRDPSFLPESRPLQLEAACRAVNVASALRRRRPSRRVLVDEYNPTAGFAARCSDDLALVRYSFARDALRAIIARGDRMVPPPPPAATQPDAEVARRLAAVADTEALHRAFTFDGVDLWPVVRDDLLELVAQYAAWLRRAAPRIGRLLRRERVGAVLVPYDTPPMSRLMVRLAQRRGIPTFLINDGWKGDDHALQGMTADTPLVTARGSFENYFSRHRNAARAVLTGDPRADGTRREIAATPAGHEVGRVIIGSFTFSPIDLNCRRSDGERFLEMALEAVRSSAGAAGAEVLFKLHPADTVDAYRDVLARFGDIAVTVVESGDVVSLFRPGDTYVTTHSTSLLQAAQMGLRFFYLAVNGQRLHRPFRRDDPVLGARTADSAAGLAALLDADEPPTSREELAAWIEYHVGPVDGRCTERVEAALRAGLAQPEATSGRNLASPVGC